jgi:hypothetical protein
MTCQPLAHESNHWSVLDCHAASRSNPRRSYQKNEVAQTSGRRRLAEASLDHKLIAKNL